MKAIKLVFLGILFIILSYGFAEATSSNTTACPNYQSCTDPSLLFAMNCDNSGLACHWDAWEWYWDNCELTNYPCVN